MLKKLSVIMIFLLVFSLIACQKNIDISTNEKTISLKEGETHELVIQEKNTGGLLYESSDLSILTVDENGVVKALKVGEATIIVKAKNDVTKMIEITINIILNVVITIEKTTYELNPNQTEQIVISTNDILGYQSSDNSVATVDENGVIKALKPGAVTITITSNSDPSVKKEVTVTVLNEADSFLLNITSKLNVNQTYDLDIDFEPSNLVMPIIYDSSDESVISFDEDGKLTTHKEGVATITLTAFNNSELTITKTITVVNEALVKSDATSNLVLEDNYFVLGETLFTSLSDALDNASENQLILVDEGNQEINDTEIKENNITIKGLNNPSINGVLIIAASNITITNLSFTGNSLITCVGEIGNFTFTNNQVNNITRDVLLMLNNVNGITIHNNVFNNVRCAINIADNETFINNISVQYNKIKATEVALKLNLNKDSKTKIWFNSIVSDSILVSANVGNKADLTLNYWGSPDLDMQKFENVDQYYLLGQYDTEAKALAAKYTGVEPVKVIITNVPEEDLILGGDSYKLTYEVLPREYITDRIRFITSDPNTLLVNTLTGLITPIASGEATITARFTGNTAINHPVLIKITTTPGIELVPSATTNTLLVGDPLKIDATPFPISIKDELYTYKSSDETIATVDLDGNVTSKKAGVVTITATLVNYPDVETDYTVEFFTEIDENDLLGLLIASQNSYAVPFSLRVYGTSFDFIYSSYQSVSRYYFNDLEVNTSKILSLMEPFSGIRPGIKKPDHPEGITPFNSDNVYWLVMHETAATNPGAGALSHANYLWNNTVSQNSLLVSWHYTVDHLEIYQHVPEDEIAYHAGDGSTRPGTATGTNYHGVTALGGGNRNGIGIEMSVNEDGDLHRTWHQAVKLATDAMVRYNLPLSHMKYHKDFASKTCPQSLIRANMLPYFESLAKAEYLVRQIIGNSTITMVSNNPEYVDNTGRVIKLPDRAMTVSYDVSITQNGITRTHTFYTYLSGTMH